MQLNLLHGDRDWTLPVAGLPERIISKCERVSLESCLLTQLLHRATVQHMLASVRFIFRAADWVTTELADQ